MLDQDISKMKVSELREALKTKGLPVIGNKQELVDRLQASMADGSHIDSRFEDDLLNDDDLDNDEKSILESTSDLLKSPDSSNSNSTTPETIAPAKKVSLKRNIIVTPLIEDKTEDPVEKKDVTEDAASTGEPEKKVIKISELTEKDRLELRAKKFGASAVSSSGASSAPSKIKLDQRAARFGLTNSTTAVSNASPEILKKRAERFGAISEVVKKTEYEEKKVKRQERFGGESNSNSGSAKVPITGPSDDTKKVDYAEKARLRLERFKQTA